MPLDAVLPAFLIAALGYVVGRRFSLDRKTLSRICLYILIPALTFDSLVSSTVDFAVAGRLVLAAVLLPLAQSLLYLAFFRVLRWDALFAKTMLLVTVFSNAGNFGLPICLFAFGQEGMDLAVVFMVTQAVMIATFGTYIAASGRIDSGTPMSQVLRMPAVYAALVGLLMRLAKIQVPEAIGRPVGLLSQACVPVFLLLLGLQLTASGGTRIPWTRLATGIGLRLVAGPALSYLVGAGLGLRGLPLKILVLEGAMPTPVNATILAEEFQVGPEVVSKATMAGTVASLVTVPLWIVLLRLI